VPRLRPVRPQPLESVAVRGQEVDLVRRDDHRTVRQISRVLPKFLVNLLEVLDGIPVLAAGYVHNVHKQTAAVDVPQKIVAQTRALRRALDDTGNVGHHEGDALLDVDDAEIRKQRGEVIVCNLRVRV